MSDRPTGVRLRILGLLLFYAALVHFNRVSIASAGTEQLMSQFKISEMLMGWISSAYLLTYTLLMTPGGWFIDRFGPRVALLVVGFGSALCVGLTGAAGFTLATAALVVPALIGIRAFMGITNVPFHPSAAHAISRWIPGPQRSGANGLVNAAALVGIAANPYLFGFMMDRFGWPAAFVGASVVTGLVAMAWWAFAASTPADHRGVNDAEKKLISAAAPGNRIAVRHSALPPWKKRSVILLALSYAAVGYCQYMFFYWIQYYFDKILKFGKADARLYTTILMVAMAIGMAAGGWLTDRAQAALGGRRGRTAVTVLGMLASAGFLGIGILGQQAGWIVTFFALALASLGACEGAFWTTAIDLGGQRGGLSAAIVNTGGNLGGALAPLLTPFVSKYFGWHGGLAVACVYCFLGAVLWKWIDPDEGIQDRESGIAKSPEAGIPGLEVAPNVASE